jgi:hypothetical protein
MALNALARSMLYDWAEFAGLKKLKKRERAPAALNPRGRRCEKWKPL